MTTRDYKRYSETVRGGLGRGLLLPCETYLFQTKRFYFKFTKNFASNAKTFVKYDMFHLVRQNLPIETAKGRLWVRRDTFAESNQMISDFN